MDDAVAKAGRVVVVLLDFSCYSFRLVTFVARKCHACGVVATVSALSPTKLTEVGYLCFFI